MDDEREHREALAAAGHTGARGAALLCALLAAIGALLGSVVVATALDALVPGLSEHASTGAGAVAGAALGVVIGFAKVVRGNREAAEQVEDREWRRELLRQHGARAVRSEQP